MMNRERRSTRRGSVRAGLAATVAASLLLVSCNGDPLDTSATTGNSQAPVITMSPSSTTVTAGQSATFTVAATGAPPLSFQWLRGTTEIQGATDATYTLSSTTPLDSGAVFSARVSNTFGSVNSSSATLTVQ
jgi:Immunoglobulin domain